MQVITGISNLIENYYIALMYFSRHLEEQPKQKWRKAQMKQWLDSKSKCLF